jgi:hypothetical protein
VRSGYFVRDRQKGHQPAMPWRDVPAFVKTHIAGFKQGEAMRAALLFLILTAAKCAARRGMNSTSKQAWGAFRANA